MQPKFEIVPEEQPSPPKESTIALDVWMEALRALSQKTIIALARLGGLAMVASVFALALSIDDPNPFQLARLGIYAVFVLIALWFMRRS